MGTAVVAIRETGDLEGRDAKRVFQLYNRLSKASVLLPPALGFVLDNECRSARKRKTYVSSVRTRRVSVATNVRELSVERRGNSAVANEMLAFDRQTRVGRRSPAIN